MDQPLFSIRMRAEGEGRHISGAETLAAADSLPELAASLVRRALSHSRGETEQVFVQFERLRQEPMRAQLPAWRTDSCQDWRRGRAVARQSLVSAGVGVVAADNALRWLAEGAAGGGESMRGAMLIDADSGERREPDPERGVRVSRMGLTAEAAVALHAALNRDGLDHLQVREALILAGKVLAAPGVLAELCWSDDPDYTTGYVATPAGGYQRILPLKPQGELRGGRAFFLRPGWHGLAQTITFLERIPVLFDALGGVVEGRDAG